MGKTIHSVFVSYQELYSYQTVRDSADIKRESSGLFLPACLISVLSAGACIVCLRACVRITLLRRAILFTF